MKIKVKTSEVEWLHLNSLALKNFLKKVEEIEIFDILYQVQLKVRKFKKQIAFFFIPSKNGRKSFSNSALSEKYFRSLFGGNEDIVIFFWNLEWPHLNSLTYIAESSGE